MCHLPTIRRICSVEVYRRLNFKVRNYGGTGRIGCAAQVSIGLQHGIEQLADQCAAEMKAPNVNQEETARLRPIWKNLVITAGIKRDDVDLLSRISDAHTLFRVTAWMQRFIANCRRRQTRHQQKLSVQDIFNDHPLRNEEVDNAMRFCLRREHYLLCE